MKISVQLRTCLLVITSFFISTTLAVCNTTQTAERQNNAVEIEFYRAQVSEWDSKENSPKMVIHIASAANSYCAVNPVACGLYICCSVAFKDIHVGTIPGYPKNDEKDMRHKLYIDLPDGAVLSNSSSLQCVISGDTIINIIAQARQGIYDATGFWITYIGSQFYGIPPDNRLNEIIIPVACVILLLVIIATIMLHFWNKRHEKDIWREKAILKSKEKHAKKVDPTYEIASIPSRDVNVAMTFDKAKAEPKRKQTLYGGRQEPEKKTAGMHSEDSADKFDEPKNQHSDNSHMIPGAVQPHLTPLKSIKTQDATNMEAEDKRKKGRKRRKKTKKRPKVEEAGYVNKTYQFGDVPSDNDDSPLTKTTVM